MSKQEKIEVSKAAKAAKAAKAVTVKKGDVAVTITRAIDITAFENVPEGQRFWNIKGTSYYNRDKGLLKGLRRTLNLKAGVNETELISVDFDSTGGNLVPTGENTSLVPAKDWPFKITKGPDHPCLNG